MAGPSQSSKKLPPSLAVGDEEGAAAALAAEEASEVALEGEIALEEGEEALAVVGVEQEEALASALEEASAVLRVEEGTTVHLVAVVILSTKKR